MPTNHQDHHQTGYGQPGWINVPGGFSSPQTSMSPIQDFPPYDYHATAPVPMEPAYNMQRPVSFGTSHAPMPPPLIMPHSGLWPSMLASQPQQAYSTPILPAGPLHTPLSAGTASDATPTSAKTPSRRKLTDDERRQMCIEAEQNPNMKQIQIGAKFNVERSTVSKILRQRDKYMNPKPKQDNSSPEKKSKARLPDFEKTLANWVKNQRKKGLSTTDQELRTQVQVFSFSRSDQEVVSTSLWLEDFKRRNHLVPSTDETEASTSQDTKSRTASPEDDTSSSSDIPSPAMSTIEEVSDEANVKLEEGDFFDFDVAKDAFIPSPIEYVLASETDKESLPKMDHLSPIVAPEDDKAALIDMGRNLVGENNMDMPSRQRSQTFPHGSDQTATNSGLTGPSLPVRSLTAATVEARPTAIDPRQMMKRNKSVPDIHSPEEVRYSSMQPPLLPRSADTSPISLPSTPAENDLIGALHHIKALLEENPSVAAPDDYIAIGKLMEKVRILTPPTISSLPGGMHPIDVMDSPRISKKRTIQGIST
ncbi:hypothetical protein B0A52_05266 [Exophiala mesophila]|uniref:HTH CENPB-type domain-containing protein n=1 Tax=Exophiala mesophila TaxID=212818 RepID=A0A438N4F8_EXOME|nr:hypothetical protein B0A52_05266 [Exophiala mesophila]